MVLGGSINVTASNGCKGASPGKAVGFQAVVKEELGATSRNGCTHPAKLVGLALSGGGIRSATFSLGILQAISSNGRFRSIDYLSTVSGGSYIGAFFGALFVSPEKRGPNGKKDADDFGTDPLGSERGRKAVARLREFGRYLTPGGTSDVMFGISLIARNWLMLQLVLGLIPLTLFLLLRALPQPKFQFLGKGAGELSDPSGAVYLLLTALLAWMAGMGLATGYWFTRKEQDIERPIARALGIPFLAMFLGTLFGWWSCLFGRWSWSHQPAIWPLLMIPSASVGAYLFAELRFGTADVVGTGVVETGLVETGKAKVPVFAIRQAEDRVRAKLTRWLATINTISLALLVLGAVNLLGHLMAISVLNCGAAWKVVIGQWQGTHLLWAAVWAVAQNFWPLLVVLIPIVLTVWANQALRRGGGPGWIARPSGQTALGLSILLLWLAVWSMAATLLGGGNGRIPLVIFDLTCINLGWVAFAFALLCIVMSGSLRLGSWAKRIGILAQALALAFLPLLLMRWLAAAGGPSSGTHFTVILHQSYRAIEAVLAALVALLLCTRLYGFANLSSLVTLYASRLKHAYIGASNPADDIGMDVDNPGDLIPMEEYYGIGEGGEPLEHLRPIHLINATVAQTIPDGASSVAAYDRKGKLLHVSPIGLLMGTGNTAMQIPFDESEPLALSDWTAISGAAAATAIGSRSSLGLSVLAMMANVRLGYWWKPEKSGSTAPVPRSWRDTMPGTLLSEMLMQFDTSLSDKRRWYLTDGGHFDNTGVYALLQRQLSFIIVCDNGADPDYRCDDMVSLIQRARTDLGADIEFMKNSASDSALNVALAAAPDLSAVIGGYAELASVPIKPPLAEAEKGGPYAALATITYTRDLDGALREEPTTGHLLLIKPRLNFTEPPELLAYKEREAGQHFPQQTTLDQFFDEDQWEAYRRFGEVIGSKLFGKGSDGKSVWLPDLLQALQPEAAA